MANVYVYSGAAGAGTGADWANAYTTIQAALTAKAAGDDFWVAHDHAQTAAASFVTLLPPGTAASPNRVICVNRSGSVPPVSADLRTTATATITGVGAFTLGGGFAYWYGLTISSASGATTIGIGWDSGNHGTWVMEQCKLKAPATSASAAKILFGSTQSWRQKVVLLNTTLEFGNTGDSIVVRSIDFAWRNTASAIAGATLPTTLFSDTTITPSGEVIVEAVDLSALASGKTLVGAINAPKKYVFKDCKLGASVTVAASQTDHAGAEVIVIRSDSADTNYRSEKYQPYLGTQTVESTIVRTSGASDGTTPISWNLTTTANSKRYLPFEALPIAIWNEITGSAITLTIEGIWGGGAVPTNADLWMDVEYLGTSGFPIGSFATSGAADVLATGTNLTSSSETWGGSTTKFKMSVTITPQEKGPITIYLKAALASSTFYIDPKVTVS